MAKSTRLIGDVVVANFYEGSLVVDALLSHRLRIKVNRLLIGNRYELGSIVLPKSIQRKQIVSTEQKFSCLYNFVLLSRYQMLCQMDKAYSGI